MTQIGGSWAGAPALLTVTVASGTGEGRAAPETGGGGASVGAAGIDAAGSGVAAVTGTPPVKLKLLKLLQQLLWEPAQAMQQQLLGELEATWEARHLQTHCKCFRTLGPEEA